MKDLFPEFYRVDPKKLWKEAVFVFDANVLLNLYRFSPKTRDKFFEISRQLDGRIWVPHQFAFEYQKNRLPTIEKQRHHYDELERDLSAELKAVQAVFQKYSRHAFIKSEKLLESIEKSFSDALKNIAKCKEKHPDWFEKDSIREQIEDLLKGRVGAPYEDAKQEQVLKEADFRFQKKTPPGFKDDKKGGVRVLGDTIGWLQILDFAMQSKVSIVFVSDDNKEDWWWEVHGKTIGPRFELIKEFTSKTKKDFHMYSFESFLTNATLIDKKVDAETIKEVAEMRGSAVEVPDVVSADMSAVNLKLLASLMGYQNEAIVSPGLRSYLQSYTSTGEASGGSYDLSNFIPADPEVGSITSEVQPKPEEKLKPKAQPRLPENGENKEGK